MLNKFKSYATALIHGLPLFLKKQVMGFSYDSTYYYNKYVLNQDASQMGNHE